ncbi:MAG: FtsX-like permease family protein, partial [Rhodothermales bacterium]
LALFLSSMIVGVAALVAISSFGTNLRGAVDEESKALLGADLIIEDGSPFSDSTETVIDSLGGLQSRRISFTSMAYFPRTGDTRLATVRASEEGYPFYGEIVTVPVTAATTYLENGGALVDAAMMKQFDVQIGDSVRIGRHAYTVEGSLEKMPRENEIMSLFSPRIFIPRARLDTTLLSTGSRADYEVAFKFDDGHDVEATAEKIAPYMRRNRVGYDTVEETRGDWDQSLTNLYRFLSIVAFIAVLLGGIGVASAIHVYVRRRMDTIAVLRCLGAEAQRTFAIYGVQAAAMGLFGGLLGAGLGIIIQGIVPLVLQDFLPVDVPFLVSWSSVASGLVLGIGVTVVFALLPLVSIRNISPLLTLRSSIEPQIRAHRDPLWWMVLALIVAGMTLFAVANAPQPSYGIAYAAALIVVFLALLGVARLVMWAVRRFFPGQLSYTWRQGLANLFRPNNQTSTLMLSLGLGTFLIATLFGVQKTLLSQIEVAGGKDRPNIVLFDIQSDQLDRVTAIVEEQELPVIDRVPIVTMRLAEVKGRTIDELRADTTFDVGWAHRREYRSTYRGYSVESERIVEGEFVAR